MARILIIDDEEQIRSVFRRILEGEGYEVDEAADGKAGTQLLSESGYDLVLLDIVMPEQDGLETIAMLRREYPSMKIVAMSGGGQVGGQDYLTLAQRLGVSRTLQKPIYPRDLRQTVRELLPGVEPDARGCQLSILVHDRPQELQRALHAEGVVCDFREPNVVRVAPTPLYNSFEDVWRFAQVLARHDDG